MTTVREIRSTGAGVQDALPGDGPQRTRWSKRRTTLTVLGALLLLGAVLPDKHPEPAAAPEPTATASTTSAVLLAAEPTTSHPEPMLADVVDGDTVVMSNGDRVRLVGIDAPERGQCGYAEATAALVAFTRTGRITLEPAGVDDRDGYGRLLRYVAVDGADAGSHLIESGLAIARYDSRDGLPAHPQEAVYHALDAALESTVCSTPRPTPSPTATPRKPTPTATKAPAARQFANAPAPAPRTTTSSEAPTAAYYANCSAARGAGAAPLYAGAPGYRRALDRDGDGVACE